MRLRALLWPGLAACTGVLAAVPLWCSHFLPFQDAPQHLAAIDLLAGKSPAAALTRRWFEIDFSHAQYGGFYLPASWLARATGPDAAIRILLTLVALLLPISAWLLLRAFGRDPRLAIFATALFHTAPLYLGIYNFVAAVPFALLVIALVERELLQPALWRAALIAVLAAVLLTLHLSGLVIAVGAACTLALTAPGPLGRRLLRALLPLAPALSLLALWAARAPSSRPVDVVARAVKSGPFWQPPLGQVRDLFAFANVLPGRADELAIAALVLLWIVLARAPRTGPSPERWWRLPLLAGGLLAAYLFAPANIGYIAYIHLRAAPFVIVFALASVMIPRTRRASLLLAAAVAVQGAYAGKLVAAYRAFDAEAMGPQLAQVLSAAAPGGRLVSLMLDRKSSAVHFEPYLHFGLYYQVLRGGRVRFNFGELPWMPARFRHDRPAQPFPMYWEFQPGFFDWRRALADADYVLVRTPDPLGDAADSPEPGPDYAAGWTLAARSGRWALFAPAAASSAGRRRVEPTPASARPSGGGPT